MTFENYLNNKIMLADGAFGTYFASKYGTGALPECANITDPSKVIDIHSDYIKAGANLIRTNTFACNTLNLGPDMKKLGDHISAGCRLAFMASSLYSDTSDIQDSNTGIPNTGISYTDKSGSDENSDARINDTNAANQGKRQIFVAGDVGPIPFIPGQDDEKISEEYFFMVQTMYNSGIKIFLFETFAGIDNILKSLNWLKEKKENEPDLFVWVQLCSNQHGYTNEGIHVRNIIKELSEKKLVDAAGLNCGIGPASMRNILDEIDFTGIKYVSAFPNASFPQGMLSRPIFSGNEKYFASKMEEILSLGADIVGGCCGTSPDYTSKIAELDLSTKKSHAFKGEADLSIKVREKDSSFWEGKTSKKLIAVELAPPFGADDKKLMDSANALTKYNVDAITLPDSPSGRTRADSILAGLKVTTETGIATIPHICCRDRNIISLRSGLLGAYMNGIRNVLAITGDPVPTLMRQEAKSVFNFDSVGLMKVLAELNREEFYKDPITYGGALSYNRPNTHVELSRMIKKIEAGASFFLTQPVFSDEDIEKLSFFKDKMKEVNSDVKLFCGLMPLVSYKNALFIQNEMSGINVPDEVIARYKPDMSREEGEMVGVSVVRDVIAKTKDFSDGYYFSIPFNRVYLLDKILD